MMNPSEIIRQRYGYLQDVELNALKEVISTLPINSVCVNVGAGFGTSGLAFIESISISKLYTVDIHARYIEYNLGALDFEMNVFHEFGFDKDPRYLQILGNSIEVGKEWKYGDIDMIFIDGDHEHCHEDINAWRPHIKKHGIMSFHDYKEPKWPEVGQAIDELLSDCNVISRAATFIALRV